MSRLPPDRPPGHEDVARAALPAYGRPADARLRLLSVSENATWLVEDEPQMVLRVHRTGYHAQGAIESELDWMAALRRDTQVRTPEPITAADGRRIVVVDVGGGPVFVDATRVVRGVTAERAPDAFDFRHLGGIMARMHEHALAWRRPVGFTRFTWDIADIVGPGARWGDWRAAEGMTAEEREVIEGAERTAIARVERFGRGADRYGLIHADLTPANLMIDPDVPSGCVTVLDFDDSGWSWLLTDLANVVVESEDDAGPGSVAAELMEGYRTVRPLPGEHLAMLPTFAMLRRIQLMAWSVSHSDATSGLPAGFGLDRLARLAERYCALEASADR